jgi:hypothetical protein
LPALRVANGVEQQPDHNDREHANDQERPIHAVKDRMRASSWRAPTARDLAAPSPPTPHDAVITSGH